MLNGRLYVMGGLDCDKLQVLEMSEENEFTWSVKADLPAARYRAASIGHEGKIWLIGGAVNHQASSSVLIYDIEADSWGTGPALPRATDRVRAATLNGELFVNCRLERELVNWIYRNAEWAEGPGGLDGEYGALASILLG